MSAADRERWRQLWQGVAARDDADARYDRLLSFYAQPHRRYHNLQHITECLAEFDAARPLAHHRAAVELAVWFHDAVYDPRATDNEERSAELAGHWLSDAGATSRLCTEVSQLVMATKTHNASMQVDAALLVDVDLSILGKATDRFWEYEAQIREEYAWVPDALFAAKRAQILKNFLARARIYTTPWFFEKYENQARKNIQASLQRLFGTG